MQDWFLISRMADNSKSEFVGTLLISKKGPIDWLIQISDKGVNSNKGGDTIYIPEDISNIGDGVIPNN